MSPGRAGRVPEYLQHVLDAIDRITNYVAGLDQATFARDLRTQDAVIRGIGVIGEASNKARAADPGIASRNPHIPWDLMYGMRNRVIHDYPASLLLRQAAREE